MIEVTPAPPEPPLPSASKPYDALGEAKRLLRTVRAGALATVTPAGEPFSSLVSVATLPDGSPLLLLSRLAIHTRHLESDPRCSLLLAQGGKGDALAHPRLTLTGRATRISAESRAAARTRFLSRHPKAELYVDFPDFSFWRLTPTGAHLNGGFARAAQFGGAEILSDVSGAATLAQAEPDALTGLNSGHRDLVRLYATVLAQGDAGDWRASGIDPEGLDLICGDRVARVLFDKPVQTPGDLRVAIEGLTTRARAAAETLAGKPGKAAIE